MRARIAAAGLEGELVVESAGTGRVARRRALRPPGDRARRGAGGSPWRAARGSSPPPTSPASTSSWRWTAGTPPTCAASRPTREAAAKVRLLREFDPSAAGGDLDVPDPYFGGPDGFADVFDMVERACAGLLEHLRAGPRERG